MFPYRNIHKYNKISLDFAVSKQAAQKFDGKELI
jgi:hypothetical protein